MQRPRPQDLRDRWDWPASRQPGATRRRKLYAPIAVIVAIARIPSSLPTIVAARWWLVIAGLILGAVIGYAVSLGGGQLYQATATLYLGQPYSASGNVQLQAAQTNPSTGLGTDNPSAPQSKVIIVIKPPAA